MKKLLFILLALPMVTSCCIDYVTSYKVDVVFRNESSHNVTLEFHQLGPYPNEPVLIQAGEARTFNMDYSVDGKNVPMKEAGFFWALPGTTQVTFEGLETIVHDYYAFNSIDLPTSYKVIEFNPKERYQKVEHTLTDEDYDYALSQQPL